MSTLCALQAGSGPFLFLHNACCSEITTASLYHIIIFARFPDIRNDYQRSEVAMDFNAGFTAAAAGLTSFDHSRKTRTCSNTGTGVQRGA
jgi:hypothetical protein